MTAVTRAGTLSRVMTSWGGTSIVTVLRSTLTILFTNGINKNSPGPLAPPWTRPRRKMTPRSYSLTILMALVRTNKTTTTTATTTMAANPIPTDCNKPKITCIRDAPFALARRVEVPATRRPFDGHYLHYPSVAKTHHHHLAPYPHDRLGIYRVGFLGILGSKCQHSPPPLAVHEHPPCGLHPHGASDGAYLADHPLLAGYGRPTSEGTRRAENPEEHAPHEHRDEPESAEQHPRVGYVRHQER